MAELMNAAGSLLSKLNRREFLRKTGIGSAGLCLHVACPVIASDAKTLRSEKLSRAAELNLFVHIAENDRITIVAHRSEMGQGIRTSLPQVVADELDADWSKIDIVQAQGDEKYGNQNTDGSQSVRNFYQPMRELGASARLMLRQAAAARWQVPLDSCIAKQHRVFHTPSGKFLSYGELAMAAAKLPVPPVSELRLKNPDQFKFIGKPVTMVDFEPITRGQTHFGIDTQLPGMVYASIERSPTLGGQVASFDASKALKVAGVLQAIKIEGAPEPVGFSPIAGVAIIATNTWAAMEGRKALSVTWTKNPAHGDYNSRATMAKFVAAITPTTKNGITQEAEGKTLTSHGDLTKAFADAALTHEAVYTLPHLEHATMEPLAATARVDGDRIELWACTQDPIGAQKAVAGVLGIKPEQVTVNITLLGGGFGRKSKADFIAEAAVLAKALGKPVKVTWTREDTTRHGYYHAFSVQHYRAALDAQHRLMGWDSTVASPSILSLWEKGAEYLQGWEAGQGFSSILYSVPNFRARNLPTPAHTRIGWMRSVYHANHAFGINSFMDELARLAKMDPLQFHLAALTADTQTLPPDAPQEQKDLVYRVGRLKQTIKAVQKSSGWPAPVGKSEGWGFAAHRSFDSYVAVVSKVSLANDVLRVLEVHIAIDCGQALNPDRVQAQMEGSVIFALSSALMGEISFKDGAADQSNFHDYPLLRLQQVPKIVVTLATTGEKHGGVGEPGVPPVAASITNAIVAAGGPRIRDLPIQRHLTLA